MPYQPIPLAPNVTPALNSVIRNVIDPFFQEFRELLTFQPSMQGPKGSFQRPLAVLVLSAADGAAQLLHPGKMENGERFKRFLKENCPWELDPPDGLTVDDACNFLWEEARCPLLHRFGAKATVERQARELKLGRMFASNDVGLTQLEKLSSERPFTSPSIKRNDQRTILWIESFYWSLRIAVQNAISTDTKMQAVDAWLSSGAWDPKRKITSQDNP